MRVAGTRKVGTETLFFCSMRAAAMKSSVLPPVHEPMYTRSILVSRQLRASSRLSGEWGLATTGSSVARSYAFLL